MQIAPTYVKQAYSLAWRFFTHNKMASFLAMAAIFALNVLSMIPLLGMFIAIFAGIVLFSTQAYVAKTLMHSESDEEYDAKVASTDVKSLLMENLNIGAGGFLGFIVIEIIMIVFIFTLFAMTIGLETLSTLNAEQMSPEQQLEMFQGIGIIGIIMAVIFMFLAYIYPIVLGRVYTSENFGEAFSAIFMMFSPAVWKASFNGQYFLLVTMLHLTGIGVMVLMVVSMMTIILIPLAMFFFYLLILYATVTAVLSQEIVFDEVIEEA